MPVQKQKGRALHCHMRICTNFMRAPSKCARPTHMIGLDEKFGPVHGLIVSWKNVTQIFVDVDLSSRESSHLH